MQLMTVRTMLLCDKRTQPTSILYEINEHEKKKNA